MRAIDADRHVREPTEEIVRLLPARLRDCAPRSALDDAGRIRQIVGGEWMPYIPVPSSGTWEIPAGGHEAKQRLADMHITSRAGLRESAKAKILRGNALRCFGLRA